MVGFGASPNVLPGRQLGGGCWISSRPPKCLPLRSPLRPPLQMPVRTPARPPPQMGAGRLSEIRKRLKTVKTALKVTAAMRLVAAARIKKAADSALTTRPFVQSLQQVMTTVLSRLNSDGRSFQKLADEAVRAGGDIDTVDEYLLRKIYRALQGEEQSRRVLLIVIGGDRGLCGMYNRLVFSMASKRILELIDMGQEVELCCVGLVTVRFFKRNFPQLLIVNSFPAGSTRTASNLALDVAEEALIDFISDEVDRVELVYTTFLSMLASKPSIRTLLPLNPVGVEWDEDEIFQLVSKQGNFAVERRRMSPDKMLLSRFSQTVRFEQHPMELLCAMMPLYVRQHLVRAVRESMASELAARLSAMRAAEDNARELQTDLNLQLNRERQESITNELNEIVGGIAQVEKEDNLF
mmetsp:Transcript_8671/g.26058  ORF Transcript_8671/g.26058 Transcript_8671/m.26058 type:complete len:409 (+) Transcript_8671:113-1339(+)